MAKYSNKDINLRRFEGGYDVELYLTIKDLNLFYQALTVLKVRPEYARLKREWMDCIEKIFRKYRG